MESKKFLLRFVDNQIIWKGKKGQKMTHCESWNSGNWWSPERLRKSLSQKSIEFVWDLTLWKHGTGIAAGLCCKTSSESSELRKSGDGACGLMRSCLC